MCRYAVAFHEVIKNSIFTYKDLYYSRSPLLEKITDSDHFPFNQAVIDEFRVQLGLLIDTLGDLFNNIMLGQLVLLCGWVRDVVLGMQKKH